MEKYNCEDEVDKGIYQCGDCSKEVKIDGKNIDVLTPCPSCGGCNWIQTSREK